jgi:hypothetical protein
MKITKPEESVFLALNSPEYIRRISNKYKTTEHKNDPIYRKLTLNDIKKLKPGEKIKFKVYEFYPNKWKTFTFKFDGIIKKDKIGYLLGETYPNSIMYIKKEKVIRITPSGDISPAYIENEHQKTKKLYIGQKTRMIKGKRKVMRK